MEEFKIHNNILYTAHDRYDAICDKLTNLIFNRRRSVEAELAVPTIKIFVIACSFTNNKVVEMGLLLALVCQLNWQLAIFNEKGVIPLRAKVISRTLANTVKREKFYKSDLEDIIEAGTEAIEASVCLLRAIIGSKTQKDETNFIYYKKLVSLAEAAASKANSDLYPGMNVNPIANEWLITNIDKFVYADFYRRPDYIFTDLRKFLIMPEYDRGLVKIDLNDIVKYMLKGVDYVYAQVPACVLGTGIFKNTDRTILMRGRKYRFKYSVSMIDIIIIKKECIPMHKNVLSKAIVPKTNKKILK